MKKLIPSLLAFVASLMLLTGCSGSGEQTLNILTWDGYIPEDVAAGFEKSTGIKLNYANFDSNEEMLAKLEATNGGGYDLVIGSDYIIKTAAEKGLLMELDKNKIPNYENLDPAYLGQYYDPENKYTVPYSAGTPLIVYDPEKIPVEITGYNDLWDPQLKGKLVLLDDARNIIGIVLKSMGESMNTTDPEILSRAEEKLMRLKPNIHHLDYNSPQESIISGESDIAYMFSPQVVLATQARTGLKVVYPTEGIGFGIDCWFVPKGAEHTDNAFAFLNYITEPKVGASISEQVLYQCPNKASSAYLSDTFKRNEALYIPAEKLGTPEFIQVLDPETTALYDKIWTSFKN